MYIYIYIYNIRVSINCFRHRGYNHENTETRNPW